MIDLKENDLVFAKVRPDATIPTKRDEDAGRDVYACFDEDYIIIPAHTTKIIPTGIASAITPKYEIRLRDRGSNGSKGIHINAGTIDSGFRNEWMICWCNTNDRDVFLSKKTPDELFDLWESIYKETDVAPLVYPYTKAIAQAEVCEVPVMNQYEITYEELQQIPSERGMGMLGSSGK